MKDVTQRMKCSLARWRILAWLLLILCGLTVASAATVEYTLSDEDFPNPERGFYKHFEVFSSNFTPMPAWAEDFRLHGVADASNTYTVQPTLILRLFYLDNFISADISPTFLAAISEDFNRLRAMGFKAIVRFAYTKNEVRPFNEPSKNRILSHLAQLKPVLHKHRDVIALVQHGFIGAYGEGYYTDIFSVPGETWSAENWNDRADVLTALLKAVPSDRMVQVRIPQQKQKHVHGVAAPTSSPPMHMSQAHTDSPIARIGFHNDCFLASDTDVGTFVNYDTGTAGMDTTRLRDYAAGDSAFVVVGGETCAEYVPDDDCASAGGRADADLERFHYSFLNQDWNPNVNDDWAAQGCINDIIRRLGYRVRLVQATCTDEAQPGQVITVGLTIRNDGYAAPFNRRGLELVLRHAGTGAEYLANLTERHDARFWLPGQDHVAATRLKLPDTLPVGEYEILLHLPDVMPSLYGRLPFTIRLANDRAMSPGGADLGTVWEPATGYHHLRQMLIVNEMASSPQPDGSEIPFLDHSSLRQPLAESIELLSEGSVRILFRGVPGEAYDLEATDELSGTNVWATLNTVTVADGSGVFLVEEPQVGSTRFYRARGPVF